MRTYPLLGTSQRPVRGQGGAYVELRDGVHVHRFLFIRNDAEWLLGHLERPTNRYEQRCPESWRLKDAPTGCLKTLLARSARRYFRAH